MHCNRRPQRYLNFTNALLAVTLSFSPKVLAQSSMSNSSKSTSGGGPYRSVLVALPLLTRGLTGRVEFNLGGRASLAVEGKNENRLEYLSKSEVQRSGESMMNRGQQGSVFLMSYTRPASLSGFFYGLGLGYRREQIDWHQPTSSSFAALTDAQYANHDARLSGATGTARAGYRYVGSEIPLFIGAYAGLQHFQSTAADGPTTTNGQSPSVTPMTTQDKEHLQRRFATSLDLAIEVGFAL